MTEICRNWFTIDGITQDFIGEINEINPVVGVGEDGLVLIDTGPPGSYDKMKIGLKKLGFSLTDIRTIIITHYHFDHVGNLHNFLHENESITVYMGKNDIPYYEGVKIDEPAPIDLDEIRVYFPNATEEILNRTFSETSMDPEKVDSQSLTPLDDQLTHFNEAGGFDVIQTPGHTPGHLSVYIPSTKVLIPGDLMMYWKGTFSGPVKTFTANFDEALKSTMMVSALKIEKLIGYHGSPLTGDVNQMIGEYLQSVGY